MYLDDKNPAAALLDENSVRLHPTSISKLGKL